MGTFGGEVDRAERRRRPSWTAVVAVAVTVVLLGVAVAVLSMSRLAFGALEGPAGPVAPGDRVTVRATGGGCGPLVVTLHREGILGFWNQTHSGNVFDGYSRDEIPWWSLRVRSTVTPVPCSLGGSSFVLPDDVSPGVIAACDPDRRCVRLRVEGRSG